MKRQTVRELGRGSSADTVLVLKKKLLKDNPDGSSFLLFQFGDKTGSIGGILWDNARETYARIREGGLVRVHGDVHEHRDALQIRVLDIESADGLELDLSEFLPSTPLDRDELIAEFEGQVATMSDPHLRGLIEDMLGDEDLRWRFMAAPAGKTWHHPYVGGLLEHTVKLSRMAIELCRLYPELDRDLMLAACYLHDLGKVRELTYESSIDYSSEGKLLGHVVQGVEILDSFLPGRPELARETIYRIKHLIVSHQGSYEFGSPQLPKTLEAIAFHHLDNLDAQIDGFGRALQEGRAQMPDSNWTGVNKILGRHLYLGGNED